ncbi:uncharacterized protein LOC136074265 [Hydra vulgaris]|uniref:Uncharacterized protein LOC136074265 n=1 Tax=Hydra vulgaris TaxID=6087 RepID=A0ABM4B1H6_HYDVU
MADVVPNINIINNADFDGTVLVGEANRGNEKVNLIVKLRVHKLRAKAFYSILKKTKNNVYTLAYDLQQVQSLPRVTLQEAYYSRQLSLYNFGLCDLNNNSNHSYTWLESQSGRGSNEIASAVFHYLTTKLSNSLTFNEAVDTIRLVSDGCRGQNKNIIMLGMVQSWLFNSPQHVTKVELIFLVRGHSFLPCDRLFGRIEKDLKVNTEILEPSGFHDIFFKHCNTVNTVNREWFVKDWKKSCTSTYKTLNGFQELKRIILQKHFTSKRKVYVTIQSEMNYKSDLGKPIQLLKRGKSHTFNPLVISGMRPISAPKLKDIHYLLAVLYGPDWKNIPGTEVYSILTSTATIQDENAPLLRTVTAMKKTLVLEFDFC